MMQQDIKYHHNTYPLECDFHYLIISSKGNAANSRSQSKPYIYLRRRTFFHVQIAYRLSFVSFCLHGRNNSAHERHSTTARAPKKIVHYKPNSWAHCSSSSSVASCSTISSYTTFKSNEQLLQDSILTPSSKSSYSIS